MCSLQEPTGNMILLSPWLKLPQVSPCQCVPLLLVALSEYHSSYWWDLSSLCSLLEVWAMRLNLVSRLSCSNHLTGMPCCPLVIESARDEQRPCKLLETSELRVCRLLSHTQALVLGILGCPMARPSLGVTFFDPVKQPVCYLSSKTPCKLSVLMLSL